MKPSSSPSVRAGSAALALVLSLGAGACGEDPAQSPGEVAVSALSRDGHSP